MNALNQKIEQMRMGGTGPKAIAHELQVGINKVHNVISAARDRGMKFPVLKHSHRNPAPEPAASDLPKLSISKPLYAVLASRAQREGRSASELAGKLLQDALIGGGHG